MSVTDSLSDLTLIWESISEHILESGALTETTFKLWFANVKLISLSYEVAVFTVENEFKLDIIKEKYTDILADGVEHITGHRPEIQLVLNTADAPKIKRPERTPFFTYGVDEKGRTVVISTNEEKPETPENADEKTAETSEPAYFTTGDKRMTYNPEYTFETFVVGVSNQFAHAAALAVAKKPGSVYNPLFIYGPSGLGKTHLMYAITNRILEERPDCNIVYVKGEEFTNQLIESLSNNSTAAFREKYRKADMLLIDDVQFIAGKKSTQEEFFHTFNALYEDHKQIILTSDRPPRDMETLEDRIKTRFESGLLADIQPPDFELRLAILKTKAEKTDLDISMDILNFLAENLHDNVRKIEGVIKKLSAKAFLTGTPITMEMARAEVQTYKPQKENQQETARRIISSTAKKYGVSFEDIMGTSRVKEIKTARNVAMYIIRKMTTISLPEIGKIMNRDHATVHSNIKAIETEIRTNSFLDSEINDIIAEVKS